MGVEGVFPRVVFHIGILPIKDTVLQTWVIMAALLGFGAWATGRFRVWEPKAWQLAVEYVTDAVDHLVANMGGRTIPEIVPYLTIMLTYIGIANLLGLVPTLQAPTRDLNATLALSLVSLASCQYYGVKRRGAMRYLRSFIEPMAFMLPLNLIGLFSRLLSMALRLFGNTVAGELIVRVIFLLVPVFVPLPMVLLTMIAGVLQALVFTILTLVFVIDAMGEATVAPVGSD